MEAHLIRGIMEGVKEDTEVRVIDDETSNHIGSLSRGVASIEIRNGVMYFVLRSDDRRIVPHDVRIHEKSDCYEGA